MAEETTKKIAPSAGLTVTDKLRLFVAEGEDLVAAAVAVAATLTVASTLIFVVALQLRIPLWGPWLEF